MSRTRYVCFVAAIFVFWIVEGFAEENHPPIPAPMLEEASTETGGVCVSCHTNKAKLPVVHPAITAMGCEACHAMNEESDVQWSVELAAEGNELCLLCHDDKEAQAQDAGIRHHAPVAQGECMGCHDPHESQYAFMLQGPVDDAGESNFCFSCHTDISGLAKKQTVHGALEMGCLVCHQTHKGGDSSEQQFAFHLADNAPSLCLGCHDGEDPQLLTAHGGQPFQSATCTDCHNPHGSDRAKLIHPQAHPPFAEKQCDSCHEEPRNGKVVLVEEGKKDLCFFCHDDKQQLLATAKVKHGLFEIDDTCTTCHSPHATDQPRWLKKPVRELCGGCHEDNTFGFKRTHGPIDAAKSCVICHEPHASEFTLHLRANIDDMCLACHRANRTFKKQENGDLIVFEGIAVPPSLFDNCPRIPIRTMNDRGHPLMQHPISGENTLAPEQGDISCVSCHRPHGVNQAENEKLLVIDGQNGANLCLNCHGKEE